MLKRIPKSVIIRISAAILILAILASMLLILRKSSAIVNYGVSGSIITYSPSGEDITETIASSEQPIEVLRSGNDVLSVDKTGAVSVKLENGGIYALNSSNHNFTSDDNEKNSVFSIDYLDSSGSKLTMFSSDAVEKGQVRFYTEKDCLNVEYLLGENVYEQVLPTVIEKERFEKRIYSKVSKSDQAFLDRQYFLYSLKSFPNEKERESILLKYPALEKHDIYVLLNSVNTSSRVGQRICSIMQEVGYTYSDLQEDLEANGVKTEDPITFGVTLSYTLQEGELLCSVRRDKMSFYRSTPMLSISLYRFANNVASGKEGQLFLPYGTGCLVEINDVLNRQVSGKWSVPVYGDDLTVHPKSDVSDMITTPKCTLPLFGSSSSGSGILTLLEKGETQAVIHSMRNEDGGYAYASFNVLQSDSMALSGKNTSMALGSDILNEDIAVRYVFFQKDSGVTYSDFADYYKGYLKKHELLPESNVSQNPKLAVEIIGAAVVKDYRLNTFPYNRTLILSSFEDAKAIKDELKAKGVDELSVKLSGWNKGGLYTQIPGTAKVSSALGGRKSLENLRKSLDAEGIGSFLSLAFNYYYADNTAEGKLSPSSMTAQFADKSYASRRGINPISGLPLAAGSVTEVISPANFEKITQKYLSSDIVGLNGIDIGKLALALNSDYNSKHFYDRSRAKSETVATLAKIKEHKNSLSGVDANLYALKYMTALTDVSAGTSMPDFIDRVIPFKQMVMHGSLSYAQSLRNDPKGSRHALLSAIEAGADLSCEFIANEEFDLKNTSLSYLNNYSAERTIDSSAEGYKELKGALSGLGDKAIVSHSIISESAVCTVYENGARIYVNYGNTELGIEDGIIPALGWLRVDR